MPIEGSQFLDPDILRQLPNMELIAKRLVESVFVGYHRSPYFGFSVEFADHREYVHGDDLRTVDWKVWARKNRYYVKRFEMENELKATIILDTSRSMDYGTGKLTKLQYGSYLAATLAYLLMQQNDMAGLVTFDDAIHHYIPPRGSRAHMRAILKALGSVKPGPATNVARVCHDLAETIKTRGMIILISDMLDGGTNGRNGQARADGNPPPAPTNGNGNGSGTGEAVHALRHFQHRKHDVIVFHVLDDSELDLPFDELSNFRDLESGQRIAVDPATFRKVYRQRVQSFVNDLRQECVQTNIDYKLVRTSMPIEAVLTEYLHFRARRSR
ncbi:MAG TPA: DUF58 domain-containing protein [Planctomycetota bacterium]|nr:DUF58 domain-containing protein [Planctomycetota bacterium]